MIINFQEKNLEPTLPLMSLKGGNFRETSSFEKKYLQIDSLLAYTQKFHKTR